MDIILKQSIMSALVPIPMNNQDVILVKDPNDLDDMKEVNS